jgi:hypothetical protein
MFVVIVVTFLLALISALAQTIMRGISRPNPSGKTHALTREDALFWSDWVLAGTVALTTTLVVHAAKKTDISLLSVVLAICALFLGCSALPFAIRTFAHDPDTGKFRSGKWWFLAANGAGMLILLAAVAAGAEVYAFT